MQLIPNLRCTRFEDIIKDTKVSNEYLYSTIDYFHDRDTAKIDDINNAGRISSQATVLVSHWLGMLMMINLVKLYSPNQIDTYESIINNVSKRISPAIRDTSGYIDFSMGFTTLRIPVMRVREIQALSDDIYKYLIEFINMSPAIKELMLCAYIIACRESHKLPVFTEPLHLDSIKTWTYHLDASSPYSDYCGLLTSCVDKRYYQSNLRIGPFSYLIPDANSDAFKKFNKSTSNWAVLTSRLEKTLDERVPYVKTFSRRDDDKSKGTHLMAATSFRKFQTLTGTMTTESLLNLVKRRDAMTTFDMKNFVNAVLGSSTLPQFIFYVNFRSDTGNGDQSSNNLLSIIRNARSVDEYFLRLVRLGNPNLKNSWLQNWLRVHSDSEMLRLFKQWAKLFSGWKIS